MRILTITAQKPNSTGSGVYLSEMVKAFHKLGYQQAVIAGVYEEDEVCFPEGVSFYPVYFHSEKLPFAICGMSDEMPYESTVYGQMSEQMVMQFKDAFSEKIKYVAEEFKPDIIVCHHLYLVTAIARTVLPDAVICGFSHNTDLRQLKKIPLEKEFILNAIPKLDTIFALHEEQKREVEAIFEVEEEKVQTAGTGFNREIFHLAEGKVTPKETDSVRLVFAGKIAEKKGVASLIRSLSYIDCEKEKLEVVLAGGAGNQQEYQWIRELAQKSPYKIQFLGRISQETLAEEYNKSDVFVLPSFSEGLPLTIIEAMACGCKVVVTDLPGIRPWVEKNIVQAPIVFVEPPEMENTDEPIPDSLEKFERNLAAGIEQAIQMKVENKPNLDRISWEYVCSLVTNMKVFEKS